MLSGPHIEWTPSIKRTAAKSYSYFPMFTLKNTLSDDIMPVHYCILEAVSSEERGISIHMQISGRVFCNLANTLMTFVWKRGNSCTERHVCKTN